MASAAPPPHPPTTTGDTCPVCLDVFDDTVAVPLVLMCGDSICRQCLVDCKSGGDHKCPLCRSTDSRDTVSIPKNFSLIRTFTAQRAAGLVSSYGRPPPDSDSSEDIIMPSALSAANFDLRSPSLAPKRRMNPRSPPPPLHRPLSTSPDMVELPSVLDERPTPAIPSHSSDSGLLIELAESPRHISYPGRIGDDQQAPDKCHVYLFASLPGQASEPAATNYQTVLVGGHVVRPCPGAKGRGVHVWARYPNGWYGLVTVRARCVYETGGDVPISTEISGFRNPEPSVEPDFGDHVTCFAVIPGTTGCLLYNSLSQELFIWCTDTSERFSVAKLEDGTGSYQRTLSVQEICITETTSAVLVTQRSSGPFGLPPVYCDPAAWIQIPVHLITAWRNGLYDQRWANLPETLNLNFERGAATQHVMAAAWSESPSVGPVFAVARFISKGARRKLYWNQQYMVNNRVDPSLQKTDSSEPTISIAIHQASGSVVSMSHVGKTESSSPDAAASDTTTTTTTTPPKWSRRFSIETIGQTPPTWRSEMFYSTTDPVLGHSSMNFCLDSEGNIWVSHGDGSILSVMVPPRSSYSPDAMKYAANALAETRMVVAAAEE